MEPNSVWVKRNNIGTKCSCNQENHIHEELMKELNLETKWTKNCRNQQSKHILLLSGSLQFHNHLKNTLKQSLDEHTYTRRAKLLGDEVSYSRQEYQRSTTMSLYHTHLAAKWVTARYSPRRRRCGLACAHPGVEVGATPSRRTWRSGGDSGGPPPSSSGRRAGREPG